MANDRYEGMTGLGAEDLTKKDRRKAALYFLGDQIGSDRLEQRGVRRLARSGIDPTMLDRSKFGANTEEDYIDFLANRGLVEGMRARNLQTKLGRANAMDRLDESRALAETTARDQIAIGAENLSSRLTSMVPDRADPGSPAMLALKAQFQTDRENDLSKALREIEMANSGQKTAIEQTALKDIGPLLQNIGFTVDALKRLKDEENRMAGIERANVYTGALLNPLRAIGGGVGGAVGGRAGAQAGGNMAMQSFTEVLALLDKIKKMGAGGAPGMTPVGSDGTYGGGAVYSSDLMRA